MGRFSLTSPALQYLAPARIPYTMCDRSHSTEVLVLDEVQRVIHHLNAHVTAYQPKCSQLSCLANAHRLHLCVLITPQQRLQDWLKVLANLRTYVSEVHLYSSFEPGQTRPQVQHGLERFSKLQRLHICACGEYGRGKTLHQLKVA